MRHAKLQISSRPVKEESPEKNVERPIEVEVDRREKTDRNRRKREESGESEEREAQAPFLGEREHGGDRDRQQGQAQRSLASRDDEKTEHDQDRRETGDDLFSPLRADGPGRGDHHGEHRHHAGDILLGVDALHADRADRRSRRRADHHDVEEDDRDEEGEERRVKPPQIGHADGDAERDHGEKGEQQTAAQSEIGIIRPDEAEQTEGVDGEKQPGAARHQKRRRPPAPQLDQRDCEKPEDEDPVERAAVRAVGDRCVGQGMGADERIIEQPDEQQLMNVEPPQGVNERPQSRALATARAKALTPAPSARRDDRSTSRAKGGRAARMGSLPLLVLAEWLRVADNDDPRRVKETLAPDVEAGRARSLRHGLRIDRHPDLQSAELRRSGGRERACSTRSRRSRDRDHRRRQFGRRQRARGDRRLCALEFRRPLYQRAQTRRRQRPQRGGESRAGPLGRLSRRRRRGAADLDRPSHRRGAAGGVDAVFGPVEARAEGGCSIAGFAAYFSRRLDRADGADVTDLAAYLGTNNSLFDRRRCLADAQPFDPSLNELGGEDSLLIKRLAMNGRRFVYARQAGVVEWVPPARLTWAYVCKRRFLSGQIRIFTLHMIRPVQWHRIAIWMAVGLTQFVLAGAASIALRPLNRERAAKALAAAYGGLGKVLWLPRFRPALYGVGLVS